MTAMRSSLRSIQRHHDDAAGSGRRPVVDGARVPGAVGQLDLHTSADGEAREIRRDQEVIGTVGATQVDERHAGVRVSAHGWNPYYVAFARSHGRMEGANVRP